MKSNAREKSIRGARRKLSNARLIAFLHAANDLSRGVLAVSLACEALGRGESLDDLFYTGDIYGYSLGVKTQDGGGYRIEFGCQAGPMAGDGGTWDVVFEGDRVTSITGGMSYIS